MTEHWGYEQCRDGTVVLRAPIEGSEALFTFAVVDTGTPGKSLARAQQIVTAVNCHEELVEALRNLLDRLEGAIVEDQGPAGSGWKSQELEHAFNQAEDVLAHAEGREKEPTR